MRTNLTLLACSLLLGGCLGYYDHPTYPDLADAPDDLATAQGNGSGNGMRDMATAADLASSDGGGSLKSFGADCLTDGECDGNMCRPFQMMTIRKCTKPCTAATAAQDCPAPPSLGTCTNQLHCRF